MTNANTNENTGASVTVNSRSPEAPSDGSGDGRSDGYGRWDYKPYYHRSGGAPKGQGEVRQGKRTGGKGKDLILVNLLTRTCIVLVHKLFFYQYLKKKWETCWLNALWGFSGECEPGLQCKKSRGPYKPCLQKL